MLALASAALFGSMTVALRFALARAPDAEAGALHTIAAALLVTLPFVAAGEIDLAGIWPFLLAGVLGPGSSQLFFTLAVRDAGPSRTSVTVGTAPLFSVAIALVLLGEPAKAGVIVGAVLIVAGGILLVREPGRPEHVKWIGLGYALAATIVFAVRDNLVRHLSLDSDVPSMTAGAVMLAASLVVTSAIVAGARQRVAWPTPVIARWLVPGAFVGFSYVALFEAFYRGTVSVVSPIVATESLFGVAFSAWFLGRSEGIGRRVVAGALLVVSGAVLITVFR